VDELGCGVEDGVQLRIGKEERVSKESGYVDESVEVEDVSNALDHRDAMLSVTRAYKEEVMD